MKKIQLVDLKGQYDKIKVEIDTAISNVIQTTAFINGPEVKHFQESLEQYLNTKHVIPCANGTDALQIALMALDLKPGDEVITPSFTYIATAEVIGLLNLTPVFVDVHPDTFTIDPQEIENNITEKTKAIVPVHLYGQCADMESIMAISNKYGIPVIEDTAQAIGANYTFKDKTKKKAGTIGAIGCTSFFPSKNLGCYGDGGAMFTDNDTLAKKLRMISNHGQERKYYHDIIGVNSRLDSIQAAVLNVKLQHLDNYAIARNEAAAYYNSIFKTIPELSIPVIADYSDHVFHQYTLKVSEVNRDELLEYLNKKDIPANVYYPLPVHLQKSFTNGNYKSGRLDTTEELKNTVISLPMHTELEKEQMEYITTHVLTFIKEHTKVNYLTN